jgi:hypothetical protein
VAANSAARGVPYALAKVVDALLDNADLIELPPVIEKQLISVLSAFANSTNGNGSVPQAMQKLLINFLGPLVDGARPVVIPTGNVGLVVPVALQKLIKAAHNATAAAAAASKSALG